MEKRIFQTANVDYFKLLYGSFFYLTPQASILKKVFWKHLTPDSLIEDFSLQKAEKPLDLLKNPITSITVFASDCLELFTVW